LSLTDAGTDILVAGVPAAAVFLSPLLLLFLQRFGDDVKETVEELLRVLLPSGCVKDRWEEQAKAR
jgi:hypothetical protein